MIVEFDGKKVEEFSALPPLVAATKPGETATARVWRNGAERDVKITVAEMAGEPANSPVRRPRRKASSASRCARSRPRKPSASRARAACSSQRADGAAAKAGVRPAT